jgi:hypothetical protein
MASANLPRCLRLTIYIIIGDRRRRESQLGGGHSVKAISGQDRHHMTGRCLGVLLRRWQLNDNGPFSASARIQKEGYEWLSIDRSTIQRLIAFLAVRRGCWRQRNSKSRTGLHSSAARSATR